MSRAIGREGVFKHLVGTLSHGYVTLVRYWQLSVYQIAEKEKNSYR